MRTDLTKLVTEARQTRLAIASLATHLADLSDPHFTFREHAERLHTAQFLVEMALCEIESELRVESAARKRRALTNADRADADERSARALSATINWQPFVPYGRNGNDIGRAWDYAAEWFADFGIDLGDYPDAMAQLDRELCGWRSRDERRHPVRRRAGRGWRRVLVRDSVGAAGDPQGEGPWLTSASQVARRPWSSGSAAPGSARSARTRCSTSTR